MRGVGPGGDGGQRVAGLDDVLLPLGRRRLGQGAPADGPDRQGEEDQQVATPAPPRTTRRRRTRGEGAVRAGWSGRAYSRGRHASNSSSNATDMASPLSEHLFALRHWTTNTCSLSTGSERLFVQPRNVATRS